MGVFLRHEACDECGSSDGKAIYEDGSHYCWVCEDTSLSADILKEFKKNKPKVRRSVKKDSVEKENMDDKKLRVTEAENTKLKQQTQIQGLGYRGITDEVLKTFGVRTKVENGKVAAVYYPCTINGDLSGWKPRLHPKTFGGSIGTTGAECDLFGQFKFLNNPNNSKFCLIVGGEHDQLAAYQMLSKYFKSKGWEFDPVVVSPTIGETGSAKQLANQYAFFDQFEKIIIGFDNDSAGREATDKAVKVLPKGKVFVATWSSKDPNKMLEDGKQKDFLNNYYDAKQYVPVGVLGSNQISAEMRSEFDVEKIPLPPFMHKLQDMMAGGIPLGRIVNLGSASGTGKSTIIDEVIYYIIFNSPHKVGVVTLEATSGQYGVKLLSRHIGKKLELLPNQVAKELLETDEVREKEYELFNLEDGTPRFYLVDDRDGDVEDIQSAIENLIIGAGCKVILLDPIHDIISALPNEEQDNFTAWQKGMVKSHNVTFLNVCHTRKTSSGQKAGSAGADLHEEDIQGSSALYKSAACNLMFSRDKESEDYIVRNTIIMKATKIRWTGKTGIAGRYFYEIETHTMWDLDDYLNTHDITLEGREFGSD